MISQAADLENLLISSLQDIMWESAKVGFITAALEFSRTRAMKFRLV